MVAKSSLYLGEILVRKKIITYQQLDDDLKIQRVSGKLLGAILLERRLVTEQQLLEALSEQLDIPLASVKDRYIDWGLVDNFTPDLIIGKRCFPVGADEAYVTFAICNPADVWMLAEAERQSAPRKIKMVLVSQKDIDECVLRYKKHKAGDMKDLFGNKGV